MSAHNRGWTDEEKKFVIENYEKRTIAEIAESLKVSFDRARNLVNLLRRKGLIQKKKRFWHWTEEEKNFVIENYSKMTMREIADHLKVPLRKVESSVILYEKHGIIQKKRSFLPRRLWTDKEKKFVIENYSKMTIAEISNYLNVPFEKARSLVNSLRGQGLVQRKKLSDVQTERLLPPLTEIQISYLAGIIDGEGTISIRMKKNTKKARSYYEPVLEITNTDPYLIKWLAQVFNVAETPRKNNKGSPYLKVAINGYGIAPILKAIEPYLIIKKPHCMLVQEFIRIRKEYPVNKAPLIPELENIYQILRTMNLRDVKYRKLKLKAIEEFYMTWLPQHIIISQTE